MAHKKIGTYFIVTFSLEEMLCNMSRQDVEQQTLIVLPQLLHVLHLLPCLEAPQEVQAGCCLQLPTKQNVAT